MTTLDYFLLCENPITDGQGRISLINIFDIINTPSLPVVQGSFSLAFRILPDRNKLKAQDNKYKIEIISPSGKQLLSAEGQPEEDINPTTLKKYIASHITLNGIAFDEWGEYQSNIYLNNKILGKRPFTIELVEEKK